jgi:hypothetical protein
MLFGKFRRAKREIVIAIEKNEARFAPRLF